MPLYWILILIILRLTIPDTVYPALTEPHGQAELLSSLPQNSTTLHVAPDSSQVCTWGNDLFLSSASHCYYGSLNEMMSFTIHFPLVWFGIECSLLDYDSTTALCNAHKQTYTFTNLFLSIQPSIHPSILKGLIYANICKPYSLSGISPYPTVKSAVFLLNSLTLRLFCCTVF